MHEIPELGPNSKSETPPILILTGPTASGKSALSLPVAEQLNAEIACMDSMQVYTDMDIGTAKPTVDDCLRVPHHLLDLVSPLQSFSTAAWLTEAEKAIADIHARGRRILFCGGTGLYMKALLDGLFQAPPVDKQLRDTLSERGRREGARKLHEELEKLDPEAASKIHPNDLRRSIRALEIYYQTGRRISELRREYTTPGWRKNAIVMCFRRNMNLLEQHIVQRTEWMFRKGLVEETRNLVRLGCTLNHTALQGLGYRECFQYLNNEIGLDETVLLVAQNTRRYAKRQGTWFRKEEAISWLDWPDNESVDTIAHNVVREFRRR